MKNRMLPVLAALILLLIAGKGVYADPQFNVISPQKDATVGIFGSNADHFMSVRDYANIGLDKWMSVVSYRRFVIGAQNQYYESNDLAQLGFAARFGDLYIGAAYIGNAWRNFGMAGFNGRIHTYTNEKIPAPPGQDVFYGDKTWKVYSNFPYYDRGKSDVYSNGANILLGIADMGFKLYFESNYQSNKQSDFAVRQSDGTFRVYKAFEEEYGSINPGIVWGMARDLIPDVGIKPQVGIDLYFFRDNRKQEDYDQETGTTQGMYVNTNMYASRNRFVPGLNLGLGGITLTQSDSFRFFADLDYGIKISFYDNEYSYLVDGKYKTERIQGGIAKSGGSFAEVNEYSHSIAPALKTRWAGDSLSLAADLGVLIGLNSNNEIPLSLKEDNGNVSFIKNGIEKTETLLSLTPGLNVAMRWAVVPDKFFLSAGGEIRFFLVKILTTDYQTYLDDVLDTDSKKREFRNEFLSAETALRLGFAFCLSENLEIQATLGVDSNNRINVFNTDIFNRRGFLGFANILATMKF